MNFTNPILYFIVTLQVSIEIKFSTRNSKYVSQRSVIEKSGVWIPDLNFEEKF